MSLPAMLLGETVNEILQASQVTRDIVEAIAPKKSRKSRRLTMSQEDDGPKTPQTQRKSREPNPETVSTNIKARRNREKQNRRSESDSPSSLQRARSRIAFRTISPQKLAEKVQVKGNGENSFRHLANRVSPKHKPWVKKAVLFPNPLFISGTATQQTKFSRTMSPVIARNEISSSIKNNKETPHKFLIKSPPTSASKFQVKIKSPPKVSVSPTRNGSNSVRKSPRGSSSPTRTVNLGKKSPTASVSPTRNLGKKSPKLSTAAKLRRSFTPTRNGNNLARKSSISPKRVTLQAFISPTRNGNFCKKSPKASISPTRVNKSQKLSTAAKLRRSFSPSRLAMRLVSPMKSRKSVAKCDDHEMVSGLKQRPVLVPKRFSMGRI